MGTATAEAPALRVESERASSEKPHRWKFYRAGGVDQVRLDQGADVLALDQLDQKLWVALSCPVQGLEFDARTLELLDQDRDAQVRPPEILAAVRWLREVLKNADGLVKGQNGFTLAEVRDDTDEGKAILASGKRILASLGMEPTAMLTVEATTRTAEFFAKAKLNGDGIVPPDAIEDEAARAVAADLIACLGAGKDRSEKDGFDQPRLERFYADCAAHAAWLQRGETDKKTLLPLGADTGNAFAALEAVRAKVDDFFARCRLAAFDPRALAALNREEKAWLEVAAKDMSITAPEVAHFPLAMIAAGKALPLPGGASGGGGNGVNPAWVGPLARFQGACCQDKTALTEAEWLAQCGRFEPYRAWQGAKAGTAVERLGSARVREILAGKQQAVLAAAIAADRAVAPEIDAITRCEKLARLCRDFHKLLENYVSFTDFYARRGAIFQAGTLYLDGRSLELCFHVVDAAKHATMGPMAKTCLAYVDCTRPGGEQRTIACAFTAGDSDNLFAGRNGLFYDRKGRDWNATIVRIVDNPISIGQAFWAPYKKVLRFIEASVARRAAAADADAHAQLQGVATEAAAAGSKPAEPKPKPKFDVGIVAAIGVALGSLATAVSGFLAAFFGLGAWIPLGVLGIVLAISGPSMLIAWLKLRQRNLGPLLDANGWAVNTLTKINIPLGGSLTALAKLPEGSSRSLVDPYAPQRSRWPKFLFALLLLAAAGLALYRTNVLHRWLPGWVPAWRTAELEGPDSAAEGTAEVEIGVPGGAKTIGMTVGGTLTVLPVTGGTAHVPTAGLAVGTIVTLTDASDGSTHTHTITIVKKP